MGMGNSSRNQSSSYGMQSTLSEINVTPLVDVMLVLLIIFMVSAPLMQQGVQVDLPQSKSSSMDEQPETMVLTINKNEEIYLKDQKLNAAILAKQIAAIYEHKTKKEIFVHADKTIPYGYVAKVMADLKNAGIDRVGLVTQPEQGQ